MRPFNVKPLSTFTPFHFHHTHKSPFLFNLFSSLAKPPNPLFADYLIKIFNFPETRALTIAKQTRYSNFKSFEKPQAVLQYFRDVGFSQYQIQSLVRRWPPILACNVDKNLKPKIEFFQQLGLPSSHMGKFLSTNYNYLMYSLEKGLIPAVEILKKILVNDKNNEDLFKVLNRSWGLVTSVSNSRLLANVKFLESCGIVGSQLTSLLRRQPRLFVKEETALRKFVSKVSDMGFDMDSRMFAHALHAFSCITDGKVEMQMQIFGRFGFSRDEYMEMVKRDPKVVMISTRKAIAGLDFYLNATKLKKEVIIRNPVILNLSMENRVIPRFRVLQIIKSKNLLEKDPSISTLLCVTETEFVRRFIIKFTNHKEELLMAYKGRALDSSKNEISTS